MGQTDSLDNKALDVKSQNRCLLNDRYFQSADRRIIDQQNSLIARQGENGIKLVVKHGSVGNDVLLDERTETGL